VPSVAGEYVGPFDAVEVGEVFWVLSAEGVLPLAAASLSSVAVGVSSLTGEVGDEFEDLGVELHAISPNTTTTHKIALFANCSFRTSPYNRGLLIYAP
jgi:hypothetical protein